MAIEFARITSGSTPSCPARWIPLCYAPACRVGPLRRPINDTSGELARKDRQRSGRASHPKSPTPFFLATTHVILCHRQALIIDGGATARSVLNERTPSLPKTSEPAQTSAANPVVGRRPAIAGTGCIAPACGPPPFPSLAAESVRRLAAYKDIHKGKRCFISANGPS